MWQLNSPSQIHRAPEAQITWAQWMWLARWQSDSWPTSTLRQWTWCCGWHWARGEKCQWHVNGLTLQPKLSSKIQVRMTLAHTWAAAEMSSSTRTRRASQQPRPAVSSERNWNIANTARLTIQNLLFTGNGRKWVKWNQTDGTSCTHLTASLWNLIKEYWKKVL